MSLARHRKETRCEKEAQQRVEAEGMGQRGAGRMEEEVFS